MPASLFRLPRPELAFLSAALLGRAAAAASSADELFHRARFLLERVRYELLRLPAEMVSADVSPAPRSKRPASGRSPGDQFSALSQSAPPLPSACPPTPGPEVLHAATPTPGVRR